VRILFNPLQHAFLHQIQRLPALMHSQFSYPQRTAFNLRQK
jgi:hypothetical protein